MRTLCQLMLASMLFVSFQGAVQAQATPASATSATKKAGEPVSAEANHHALSAHHASAAAHAKALHHHAATQAPINKEIAQEHVEHTGKALEAAKKHHAAVESATAGEEKLKAHHDAIKEHHAKAAEHHTALKSEVVKPIPDPKVVKEHAAAVHHHVNKAEAENASLKAKRKIKQPAEPPAAK